ncbi:hypothetical protein VPNG_07845 [Cytospora leucostoma]|uniref:HNH nuclease domain-containing protein n=1 Tax=Cytospora leucostoma TaxID=1230097 RepID=A0A423WGR9_9PEZI|nr:hypothetical protein VPNG_07845 [Cytospora leucostoma]
MPTASATSTIPSTIPFVPPPRPTQPRCILSNNPYSIQKAHLVPSAQRTWFQANSMIHYGNDRQFVHNDHNMVPMRQDLHTVWDSHLFALVPKRGSFVVHVLTIPDTAISEFATEWHNRPVQEGALDNTGKAYLLAKFAQAVFVLLRPFIAYSAVPRFIVTLETRADDPRHPYEAKEGWVPAFSLSEMYSARGSRNPSASADSRKRPRSQASAHGDEDEEGKWSKVYVCGMSWTSESEEDDSGSNW